MCNALQSVRAGGRENRNLVQILWLNCLLAGFCAKRRVLTTGESTISLVRLSWRFPVVWLGNVPLTRSSCDGCAQLIGVLIVVSQRM